jgi:hypothetical protein
MMIDCEKFTLGKGYSLFCSCGMLLIVDVHITMWVDEGMLLLKLVWRFCTDTYHLFWEASFFSTISTFPVEL